jgi:predicted nuclease with TOPRIM domain
METERKYIGKINELETQNQTKQSELNQTKRSLNDANSRISRLEEFKDTVEEKILNPVKKYFEKEFTALVKMAQRKEFEDKVSEGFESNKQELEQEPTKKTNNLPSFKPKTPFDRSEG